VSRLTKVINNNDTVYTYIRACFKLTEVFSYLLSLQIHVKF